MATDPSNLEEKRGGLRSDQFSGLMLLALAGYVAWENRAYPAGSLHEPGPGYMPLALAIFLGAMGLLVAIFGGGSTPLSRVRWPELGRAIVILGTCGVSAFALEHLGYRLTMLAMLIFFLGVVERKHWLATAAASAGFSFLSYSVFATWLRVPLPLSPWGF